MIRDSEHIIDLIHKLEAIKEVILEKERSFPDVFFEQLHPSHRLSALNLIHYLGMRLFDIRQIQEQLSTLGLSSLSHSERYTMVNINNILHILYRLSRKTPVPPDHKASFTFNYPGGSQRLEENTAAIFGTPRRPGSRIMVTLPPEAATDPDLVRKLISSGMDIARINCSHDNEQVWTQMVSHIRHAAELLDVPCLVYMDLPGPKLRTGEIDPELVDQEDSGRKKKGPALRLKKGELLHLYRDPVPGAGPRRNESGQIIGPARISVNLAETWKDIQVGQQIFFNDGKIGARIEAIDPEKMKVRITRAKSEKGSRLRKDKGINLPETDLNLPSLTSRDLEILPFICRNADMVGYSFVRKAGDMRLLRDQLGRHGRGDLPVILKIETKEAFKNLPELLLESMRSPRYGVMLARGDLAIEVGFTRIAEVQEQILWLCDAAHVPIIWATQVLENLIKEGLASRAEITDAAMSVRAECVMLNKGPFIREAMEALANIDERMVKHMFKKHGALRPLNVARRFFQEHGP